MQEVMEVRVRPLEAVEAAARAGHVAPVVLPAPQVDQVLAVAAAAEVAVLEGMARTMAMAGTAATMQTASAMARALLRAATWPQTVRPAAAAAADALVLHVLLQGAMAVRVPTGMPLTARAEVGVGRRATHLLRRRPADFMAEAEAAAQAVRHTLGPARTALSSSRIPHKV
jgi:hypothetical protein